MSHKAATAAGMALLFLCSGIVTSAEAASAGTGETRTLLWRDPGDVRNKDLFYGSGGMQRRPRLPLTFVREDSSGTTPKFIVRDRSGTEWRVKLGKEARSETAATRFMWATGYYTDDDYVVHDMRVYKLPKLRRGNQYVEKGGTIRIARLERALRDGKYAGSWRWKENPFSGTRELNGLKVLMALTNNWDLKDSNTSIYEMRGAGPRTLVYLVGDVGATFGKTSYIIPSGKSNPEAYDRSRFITEVTPESVSFQTPSRSPLGSLFFLPHFFNNLARSGMRDITKDLPRGDVRWIGEILMKLTDHQIRRAFEAAGYYPTDVRVLSSEMTNRIVALSEL